MKVLQFSLLSGGTVTFNLDVCGECVSKVCVAICNDANMGRVLELRDGLPALRVSPAAVAKGACTECLGCELECEARGRGGVHIVLPMPELDEFIRGLSRDGAVPMYPREDK